MIYICVPSHNDARTVGLVLWKIRQVFGELPREYQVLVADDGSTDDTATVLNDYEPVLPMSVIRHDTRLGYAETVEHLLERAVELTDRPKRDAAIVVPGDFGVSPGVIPDLVRRIESGADLVVAEGRGRPRSPVGRLVGRMANWLLSPGLSVPGVGDLLSGVLAVRLVTLKRCMRGQAHGFLLSDGLSARAELVARTASEARQISTVAVEPREVRNPPFSQRPLLEAFNLFRTGRTIDIPPPRTAVQGAP